MKRLPRSIVLIVLIPVLLLITAARSSASDIDPFIGHYIGSTISSTDDQVSQRDFDVTIKAEPKGGFEVSWTTLIHHEDGFVKKKATAIAFKKTEKPGVFRSAQKTDLFGNQVPYDPMEGDPYIWARVQGATLSVYGLHVMDNGEYEIQIYHRTLTDTGIDLEFIRTRESGVVRRVSGTLHRLVD